MAASSPVILRAGARHIHDLVGTRYGWRGGGRCGCSSRPQAALRLARFSRVAAELFEVAEREHRVGVPVRNCSGIGRVKGSRAATTLVLTALQAIERLDLLMFAVVLHPVVREPALCLGCPAFRAGRRWRWPFGQATRAGRAAPGRRRSAVSVRGASARPSVAAFQRTTAGAPTSMGGLWALIE